jgi:tetratricopeptide (TPR) repeat protein
MRDTRCLAAAAGSMLESGAQPAAKIPFPDMPSLTWRLVCTLPAGCLLLALHGCQSAASGVVASGQIDADEARPAAVSEKPVVPSTWSAETLGDLLIGEVAGKRGQFGIALDAYLRQAESLRDPELAARATRIAWYARRTQEARDAATLWAELAPADAEANAHAVMGLVQAGQIEDALPLLDRLLATGDTPVRFQYLVQYAREATPEVRQRVVSLVATLSQRHPRDTRLWIARASLAELEGNLPEALTFARKARELDAEHIDALELEGRLLLANGEPEAARRLLRSACKRHPRERDLRLIYLRSLLDTGRGDDARDELTDMARLWPEDGDLALSLALVEWETGAADAARARMVRIAETGYREDEAWQYAGRIAFGQARYEDAATYFQNVRGNGFLQAQVQVAYAWQRSGRLEDARQLIANLRAQLPEAATTLFVAESEMLWRAKQGETSLAILDEALAARSDDKELRYARAMAAERVGRIDITEADLRLLLAGAPENAMLLNALGYTLADRTTRHDEARTLIERAIALSPDDPAIIDSMGWVQYRLGNLPEALRWLRRAYSLNPDGEIAAHLGEVLWASGKKREARATWKRALALEPDHVILRRTLERLDP